MENRLNKFFIVLCLISVNIVNANVENRLNELEARVDDVELNQALSKLNFSGSFLNQYQSLQEVNKTSSLTGTNAAFTGDDRDSNLSVFFMRAELNFDVDISSNLDFYSTIGMSKFWNIEGRDDRSPNNDGNFKSLSGGYSFKDSSANFDVAYATYSVPQTNLSFSMGRMTTNNGPPVNQNDGVQRSGTYPFLSYNVIFDGAGLVYDFKDMLSKKHSLKLRLFYTPFLTVDNSSKTKNRVDDQTSKGGEKNPVDSKGDFITLLTEYSYLDSVLAEKIDIYFSTYTFDGYYDQYRQNPSTDEVDYAGTTAYTGYLGFQNLLSLGLNISYSHSIQVVRGNTIDEFTSRTHLFNANYLFDNSFNGGDILGLEYINNTENKVPVDSTSLYIPEFYDITKGYGLHLFYSIPVGMEQIIRFGYMEYEDGISKLLYDDIRSYGKSSYIRWKIFF